MKVYKQLLIMSFSLTLATFNVNAAMTDPNSGDSSLILTLIGANSATFDLGFNYSNYSSELFTLSNASVGGQYYIWDLANDNHYSSTWKTFIAGKDLSSVSWGILAGDNAGFGAGATGLVLSYAGYAAGRTELFTLELNNRLSSINSYFASNNILGSHPTDENGASISTFESSNANSIYQRSTKKLFGTNILALSGFDSTMPLLTLTSASGAFLPEQVSTNNIPNFTLSSSGILTYYNGRITPVNEVPEADTWAMMLLGLCVVVSFSKTREVELKPNLFV